MSYPNEKLDDLVKQHPGLRELLHDAAVAARKVNTLEAQLARARLEYSRTDAACHAYRQELQRQQDARSASIDPAISRAFAPTQS